MANPLSGFMLGLLGAGEGLSAGVQTYERRKEKESQGRLREEEIGLERQKLADQEGLIEAKTEVERERANLLSKTDPNRPRGGGSLKDAPLTTLRSTYDAYLNRSKVLPLSPDERSEFEGIQQELNKRLGVTPKAQPAAPAADNFSLLKWLTGGGSSSQPQAETQKPKWMQYDR